MRRESTNFLIAKLEALYASWPEDAEQHYVDALMHSQQEDRLVRELRKRAREGDALAAVAVRQHQHPVLRKNASRLFELPARSNLTPNESLHRAATADESQVHPWSCWTEDIDTAFAYTEEGVGHGGAYVRSIDADLQQHARHHSPQQAAVIHRTGGSAGLR